MDHTIVVVVFSTIAIILAIGGVFWRVGQHIVTRSHRDAVRADLCTVKADLAEVKAKLDSLEAETVEIKVRLRNR